MVQIGDWVLEEACRQAATWHAAGAKRFPVESLKVDRSFVDGLGRETEATAICTAVVSLAHALGMRAVAEGVETPEQLATLRTLGCELAQGYLFGRPAPADFFAIRERVPRQRELPPSAPVCRDETVASLST